MHNDQSLPVVSVILPVYNGQALLDRALRSVQAQTYANWEIVAVDDGSTDGTYEALQGWAAKDQRIQVVRLHENRGPSAARNAGLQVARGQWIVYLDHDDEFYPDYFEQLSQYRDGTADVLVFGYDMTGADGSPIGSWDPASGHKELFSAHIAMPLALAHRRTVIEQVEGFNELLWWEEDAEFLRRLARAGIEITFVPQRSGRYCVRPDSRRRSPRLTRQQRQTIEANWQAGRPIYTPADGAATDLPKRRENRRILFASPYAVLDYTSGAAVATAAALRFLKQIGFECRAFCGSYLDVPREGLLEEMLVKQQCPYETQLVRAGQHSARVVHAEFGKIPVTIFRSLSTLGVWADDGEISAFLQVYAAYLDDYRPNAVWLYGGDPVADAMIKLAKSRDIPVVFGLHNFGYNDPGNFATVDYVTVPSDFSRRYYWQSIGLACHTLPYAIDWQRIEVARREPGHVTFVNPQPQKGLFVFARIAEMLARQRPDIRLLVVEGRSSRGWRQDTGIDLGQLGNLKVVPSTGDPRDFYAETSILLMPSLWNESFGLVAAEAMINGIPVLASDRGALPDTVGDAAFQFNIPACYTSETAALPQPAEVAGWVETIIRLWDDKEAYRKASEAARRHAEQWRPECIAGKYREFFGNLTPQPGPPLVPR